MTAQLQTIAALASGAGRAGVAVLRVSGPDAGPALAALAGGLPRPRRAALRTLAWDGETLDSALVLWLPGPASFTGEDVAELHVHGGPAVIAAVLDALLAQPGVRLAEPGEFTRRAFGHGKLDLTQAEALADLVDAETDGQRRQALAQMSGALGAVYEDWRARLTRLMALLEAEIDFPDEDLPAGLSGRALAILAPLKAEMAGHLADQGRGERVRDGYRVAIIGAPNAGKSSLLNALARREAAIVSDIPGTTRDVVEIRLVLAGFPVWIADTAGLREAADAIEAEGVRRALERAEAADLRLGVVDGADPSGSGRAIDGLIGPGDLTVWTKADLGVAAGPGGLPVSTKTGQGLAALEAALAEKVTQALAAREAPALTRARHRTGVAAALAALGRAETAAVFGVELAAEEARQAAQALGRLTGRIDVEDILGEIFASFCIGK
jgi:tRNA modification GTPase